MKRGYLSAVLAVAMCYFATASFAEAKSLLYGSFLPPQSNVHKFGVEPFIAEVKAATNGSVDFSLRSGGQLFGARETLRSVGGGVADAGVVIMSFTQTALKNVFTIVDLALLVEDPLAAQGAALETIFSDCPECISDFRRNKTVLLATYGLTPYVLMCNSDVKDLGDVQGKRIRTSGPNARWAKAMGGSPVGMSVADMIEGIQRGQIDCIIGPMAWITNYKIESHIKSVIDFPMGVFLGASHAVLSRSTWDGFSAAEKEAILRAAPKSTSGVTLLGYYEESRKARASAEKNNVVIRKGSQQFRDLLKKSKAGEIAAVAAAAKKRGVRDPQKIIDTYLGKVEKWNKIIADAKINLDDLEAAHTTYSKILWDEVYSKLDPGKM